MMAELFFYLLRFVVFLAIDVMMAGCIYISDKVGVQAFLKLKLMGFVPLMFHSALN